MKYALLSVSDKTGITDLATELHQLGYKIISTGGTGRALKEVGIPVVPVQAITGFSEMMNGRVKTLHPMIHGGILADRDNHFHKKEMEKHRIPSIEVVVVNLYPFKETIKRDNITDAIAIEQIDIGGPTMLRSAAKNFKDVLAVSDPSDYELLIEKLKSEVDYDFRRYLARKVFEHTYDYDKTIANYLLGEESLDLNYTVYDELRYGENPHQKAKVYKHVGSYFWLDAAVVHQGKQLSYNNLQDTNATLKMLAEYSEPTAVCVKHMNPCGIASSKDIYTAYSNAYEADSVSIFGGIVAVNREIDLKLAEKMNEIFLEIVIAPSFTEEALEEFSKKKNLRVLELDLAEYKIETNKYTSLDGGLLVQEQSNVQYDINVVTELKPSEDIINELLFLYKACKHVKSNAIVVGKDFITYGVGAGQMNRVAATRIAVNQAKDNGQTTDLLLASDAFFPFADSVDYAKDHGVKWIIQPGGSIKDKEVIAACNEHGIGMIFTGKREFQH